MTATVHDLPRRSRTHLELELNFGVLKAVSQLISPFVCTDEARPVLCSAHFTADNGCLRFEATDSYRLVRFDSAVAVADTLDVTIPWSWVQRSMRAMTQRREIVQLVVTDSDVTMRNGTEAYKVVHAQGVNYPDFDSMVDVPNIPELEPAAFDPKKLRDLATVLTGARYVQLWQMTKLKPLIVKFKNDGDALPGQGVAALMPIRVP